MYVTSLDLGSLGQNYFHSVRSVPFQLQAEPQSHGPIIEALLIIKSVFTVYKYSPNKMAIGRDKINLLIFCWPNFAKNTTEGAFLCENIYECIGESFTIFDNALES